MENTVQFQTKEAVALPDNFRKQLAVAVRSIQWSYAIFWSLSATQPGVLEWVDGYYNGDIKTRKTVQAVELKADKIALQRSEQLRELYLSLLEGDIEQQAKRPSAALSPEDLSDAEWYFLVCMSFVFNPGQGLPGRAFASSQTVWLSDAQYADSKVFSRSLLAKSASIQTVACFPHLGGVIEIGVTELIAEDPGLIQHVRASLLDISKPDCLEKSFSAVHSTDDDKDPICAKVDLDTAGAVTLDGIREFCSDIKEEPSMDSPDDCSHGCEHNHQTEDSTMLEGFNGGGASLVESWHFMDEDLSNGIHHQMTSSDCISEVFVNRDKALSSPKSENIMRHQLKELEEGNDTRLSSLDLGADNDIHYKRTVSAVLRSSNLMENWSLGTECRSSFVSWKNGRADYATRGQGTKQSILKQILIAVPLMHGTHSRGSDHKASQRRQLQCQESSYFETQIENEKFQVLKSMVPSVHETDKVSVLDHMIKYLKELEARVEELESCMDSVENEAKPRKTKLEMTEQMSDNYGTKKFDHCKKPWINKRKAGDIDEPADAAPNDDRPPTLEVKVSMKEDVIIEMRCPHREYILVDIMDEINNLHLEAYSVQSSTLHGILALTLKSKFRGAAVVSAGMIRQALWKIASKS